MGFLTKDLGPEKVCGFLERLDDDIFVFTANKSDTISIFHLNSKLSKSASMVGRIVALGVSNDLIAAFDDKFNLCIFELDGTIRAKTKSTNIEQLIFTKSGHLVSTHSEGSTTIWEIKNRSIMPLKIIPGHALKKKNFLANTIKLADATYSDVPDDFKKCAPMLSQTLPPYDFWLWFQTESNQIGIIPYTEEGIFPTLSELLTWDIGVHLSNITLKYFHEDSSIAFGSEDGKLTLVRFYASTPESDPPISEIEPAENSPINSETEPLPMKVNESASHEMEPLVTPELVQPIVAPDGLSGFSILSNDYQCLLQEPKSFERKPGKSLIERVEFVEEGLSLARKDLKELRTCFDSFSNDATNTMVKLLKMIDMKLESKI